MMQKVKKAIKERIAVIAACAVALAVLTGCATPGGGDELSLEEAIAQSAAAFESPHGNLSAYIMDELVDALADSNLEVADRNNLAYVYRELDLQAKDIIDITEENDRNTQSVGAFLGAQYVITGQLVDTGGGYRYRLNGINVETALHESSTRLDVRNDRHFQELAAALQEAAPPVRTARYNTDGTSTPRTAGTFLDRGIAFASRGGIRGGHRGLYRGAQA
ncbi:MAG: CsgG/HfaB family protein [Spirochaetaceae bacterium]|jgi:TolB-like protein|nr:CsgG/HfaB family protein [Spirochaetaceae bacterium]